MLDLSKLNGLADSLKEAESVKETSSTATPVVSKIDRKVPDASNSYLDKFGTRRWKGNNKVVDFSKAYDTEMTAPNGAKLIVRIRGTVVIPHGKIEYLYGNAAVFTVDDSNRIRELQRMKQTDRVEYDKLADNELSLKKLKEKKHNFERSAAMAATLMNAGILRNKENVDRIFDALLDAGNKATPQAHIVNSDIRGTKGIVRISSVWRFIQNGAIRLDAVDLVYLSTLMTKPITGGDKP